MSAHGITSVLSNTISPSTGALISRSGPEMPTHSDESTLSHRSASGGQKLPGLASVMVALLLALSGVLLAGSPADAASDRALKSVRYDMCVYAYGDPLEDLYSKACSTTPAKYGNWSTTLAGYYNNHPLWILTRQGGSCLGVLGSAASNYLYSSCAPANSRNVWEVFMTSSGRYVLKSFGAYRTWGQHKCLTFAAASGSGSVRLGACNLSSTSDQIFR